MKEKHFSYFLLALWSYLGFSVYQIYANDLSIQNENYYAFFFLSGITFMHLMKMKWVKTMTFIMLIWASLNLISFSASEAYVETYITIGVFSIPSPRLHFISLIILLVFIGLNWNHISKKLSKLITDEEATAENNKFNESMVMVFEKKFQSKSKEELEAIIEKSVSFQEEAIVAAKNLIATRDN